MASWFWGSWSVGLCCFWERKKDRIKFSALKPSKVLGGFESPSKQPLFKTGSQCCFKFLQNVMTSKESESKTPQGSKNLDPLVRPALRCSFSNPKRTERKRRKTENGRSASSPVTWPCHSAIESVRYSSSCFLRIYECANLDSETFKERTFHTFQFFTRFCCKFFRSLALKLQSSNQNQFWANDGLRLTLGLQLAKKLDFLMEQMSQIP